MRWGLAGAKDTRVSINGLEAVAVFILIGLQHI